MDNKIKISLGILIVILLVGTILALQKQNEPTTVMINVTEGNSTWKITNAGTTNVEVKVKNGFTAFVIKNLGIGKTSEIPKENVEITAKQND